MSMETGNIIHSRGIEVKHYSTDDSVLTSSKVRALSLLPANSLQRA